MKFYSRDTVNLGFFVYKPNCPKPGLTHIPYILVSILCPQMDFERLMVQAQRSVKGLYDGIFNFSTSLQMAIYVVEDQVRAMDQQPRTKDTVAMVRAIRLLTRRVVSPLGTYHLSLNQECRHYQFG